ncbi:sulfite exporter TauE/SafE family protein [Thermodesulfobacteriota bacterium]
MLSTDALYFIFLTTGFMVGFGHCIGMCGPIVVSISLSLKGKNVFVSHIFYNAGRISTYGVLGGVMGAVGSFTAVSSRIVGIQKGVMIIAGVLIIVMGLAMSNWISFGNCFKGESNIKGVFVKEFQKLSANESYLAYYPLGLLLGLLPCGPVYTALVAAAGSGMEAKNTLFGFLSGAGLMLVFGLGTIPPLILVAKLADLGWLKSRQLIYTFGSVLMIVVGLSFVFKGIRY